MQADPVRITKALKLLEDCEARAAELARLTVRQREALLYVAKGFTHKEIADLMGVKCQTANDHLKAVFKRLKVHSRAEAAVVAAKAGMA